jgi:hypothetical protein
MNPPTTASPLMFAGSLLVVLLVVAVVVVVEAFLLNLLRWDEHRACLRAALLANLISTPAALLFLTLSPSWGSIALAGLLSSAVEGFILKRRQPRLRWANWVYALVVNIASYGMVIGPAYLLK